MTLLLRHRWLPILVLVLVAATSMPGAARGTDPGPVRPDQFLADVKFLASDDLAGRGNGTPGLEKAAAFIADRFKRLGLEPGGDGGTWFQPFELVTGLKVGTANQLTLAGPGATLTLALGRQYYPLSYVPADDATRPAVMLGALPVVFAGFGISASALGYDDYKDVDVTGAAVLVFSHEPQENDPASRFDGRSPTVHASLINKAMAARAKGAKVLVVVQDPSHDRDEAGYASWAKDPQAEELGIPVLRVERAAALGALGRFDLDALARAIDTDLVPRSRVLDGVTVGYTETLQKERHTVRNVVGILRGHDRARADEAIVIGSHYDHLGLGGRHSMSPQLTGEVHNGADDNASGTSAMLEIARAAAASRAAFPRTLVFVAFAGEELGLLGSAHYVDAPAVPLERTVAMLNLDMVGRPRGRVLLSGLEVTPDYRPVVDDAGTGLGLEIRPFQEGAGVGSSDDTSFLLKKVPAIGFFSGFHEDYHRPTDDWQKIDPAGGTAVANLAYRIAQRIAARTDRPAVVAVEPAQGHGSPSAAPSGGGYGPYFGSVPDFGENAEGVKFAEGRENSPAAKAGLRKGDIMVSFDRQPMKTLYDFTYALRTKAPGDVVDVTVLRGAERGTVTVTLSSRP